MRLLFRAASFSTSAPPATKRFRLPAWIAQLCPRCAPMAGPCLRSHSPNRARRSSMKNVPNRRRRRCAFALVGWAGCTPLSPGSALRERMWLEGCSRTRSLGPIDFPLPEAGACILGAARRDSNRIVCRYRLGDARKNDRRGFLPIDERLWQAPPRLGGVALAEATPRGAREHTVALLFHPESIGRVHGGEPTRIRFAAGARWTATRGRKLQMGRAIEGAYRVRVRPVCRSLPLPDHASQRSRRNPASLLGVRLDAHDRRPRAGRGDITSRLCSGFTGASDSPAEAKQPMLILDATALRTAAPR